MITQIEFPNTVLYKFEFPIVIGEWGGVEHHLHAAVHRSDAVNVPLFNRSCTTGATCGTGSTNTYLHEHLRPSPF